jgi:hypothetical protein
MRVRALDRVVVAAAVFSLIACVGLSVASAAQDGELSLQALVKKILGLETRVDGLEERIAKLESSAAVVGDAPKAAMIEIRSPQSGDKAVQEIIVEGIVRVEDIGDLIPVVGVHPVMTNTTWIQPLPMRIEKRSDGYVWRSHAYIGTATLGVGEKYELVALLVKKGRLKENDQLERLPADVPVSSSVLVTRK